ncbi:hypothetical protein Esti_000758 [Eimeria stiedai]
MPTGYNINNSSNSNGAAAEAAAQQGSSSSSSSTTRQQHQGGRCEVITLPNTSTELTSARAATAAGIRAAACIPAAQLAAAQPAAAAAATTARAAHGRAPRRRRIAFLLGLPTRQLSRQHQQQQQQVQRYVSSSIRDFSSCARLYCSDKSTWDLLSRNGSSSNTSSRSRSSSNTSSSGSSISLRDGDFIRRLSKWVLLRSFLNVNANPTAEQLLLHHPSLQQQQQQQEPQLRELCISRISDLQAQHSALPPGSGTAAAAGEAAVCGRISNIRNGGVFFDISPLSNPNGAPKLQIYTKSLKRSLLGIPAAESEAEGGSSPPSSSTLSAVQQLLPLLDVGDVVLVRGPLRRTLRGELTLDLSKRAPLEGGSGGPLLVLLAKQLLTPEAAGAPQNARAAAVAVAGRMLLLQHIAERGAQAVYAAAVQKQQKQRQQHQQQQEENSHRNPWLPELVLLQQHLQQMQQQLQSSASVPAQQARSDDQQLRQQQQEARETGRRQQQQQEDCTGFRDVSLLLQNPSRRRLLHARAAAFEAIRASLHAEGYLAVDTPCLLRLQQQQQQDGGSADSPATAIVRLFKSRLNATKAEVVLRQAPELNLKKLIIAGVSDKLYEAGRCFRNEGVSWRHHFEFLSLEVYATLATAARMRLLLQQLLVAAAAAVAKNVSAAAGAAGAAAAAGAAGGVTAEGQLLVAQPQGEGGRAPLQLVNLSKAFREVSFFDVLEEYTNIPVHRLTHDEALRNAELLLRQQQGQQQPLPAECYLSKEHLAAFLFKRFVERRLVQPTHVLHPPLLLSPLAAEAAPAAEAAAAAAAAARGVALAERFETYIGGMEVADGYAELACPFEQRRRLARQLQLSKRGDPDATLPDQDFVHCLSLGLPPTAGLGVGLDRLLQLLTGCPSCSDSNDAAAYAQRGVTQTSVPSTVFAFASFTPQYLNGVVVRAAADSLLVTAAVRYLQLRMLEGLRVKHSFSVGAAEVRCASEAHL